MITPNAVLLFIMEYHYRCHGNSRKTQRVLEHSNLMRKCIAG